MQRSLTTPVALQRRHQARQPPHPLRLRPLLLRLRQQRLHPLPLHPLRRRTRLTRCLREVCWCLVGVSVSVCLCA